jgi:TIR domain
LLIENSIAFVSEIYNQCGQNAESIVPNVHFKELVFLSYSRDDHSIAEKLKNEFNRNGIRVFFDKDSLKTGGNYDDILIKTIKECDYFIVLISKNSIGNKNRYAYETEWSHAIAFDSDKDYLRPYIIDDTSPGDENIPQRIRKKTITKIENFDDYGPVVRKFIQENKLTPISHETRVNPSIS